MRQAMEYGASNYILKLSMSVKDLRETLVKISKELAHKEVPIERTNLPATTAPKAKITHPEVNKIIQYIEQHYDQDITLKFLARYVMMGENYVSALFKKKTGETLIHYLHRTRINKAIEYLTDTDWPVNQIGHQVGFMNDNYFIKIFKRMTGTTPSQYRQQK